MNYIGVQAQPSLRYFHIDHFNSDIYTAPENALGCVLGLILRARQLMVSPSTAVSIPRALR